MYFMLHEELTGLKCHLNTNLKVQLPYFHKFQKDPEANPIETSRAPAKIKMCFRMMLNQV